MKVTYRSGCNGMIFTLCLAASCISQVISYSSDSANGQAVDDVTKGSLGMLRLARGLQMLRLGKRLPSGVGDSKEVLSLRDFIQALISQPRDETRRQPPVPRYGRRDLESLEKHAKDLYRDPELDYPDIYYPKVYRPIPRGGRYRRAPSDFGLGTLPQLLFGNNGHDAPLSLRTVVRPRIGRYLDSVAPPQSAVTDLGSDNGEARSGALSS